MLLSDKEFNELENKFAEELDLDEIRKNHCRTLLADVEIKMSEKVVDERQAIVDALASTLGAFSNSEDWDMVSEYWQNQLGNILIRCSKILSGGFAPKHEDDNKKGER